MIVKVKSACLAITACVLAASIAFISRQVGPTGFDDIRSSIDKTRETLLQATLVKIDAENVEASLVANVLNASPYIRELALIAKYKKPMNRSQKEVEALTYYYFAVFNLQSIQSDIIDPIVEDRKRSVERALIMDSKSVTEIKDFTTEEIDEMAHQKELADTVMTAIRKSVLAAAYLHERVGRRAVAIHYYDFFLSAAQKMSLYFNYFGSPFVQDLLTIAQFKSVYLRRSLPILRQDYEQLSYFNRVLEEAVQSVLQKDLFDRYRAHGWLGGPWSKIRLVEAAVGTVKEPFIEYETKPLADLSKDIELKDDPFLFFEICASIWANADGNEIDDEIFCPLSKLKEFGSASANHFIASLSSYLYLRAAQVRTRRQYWEDASKRNASLRAIASSMETSVVADSLKDDLAYMLFFENYEDNYKRSRPAFITVFPFGQYDATPAILELD